MVKCPWFKVTICVVGFKFNSVWYKLHALNIMSMLNSYSGAAGSQEQDWVEKKKITEGWVWKRKSEKRQ